MTTLAEDFNELEELLDTPQEVEEEEEEGEGDDSFDLDDLLEESTALAGARKAKRQGRKLTAEQQEMLEVARLTAAVVVWDTFETYGHIVETTCTCGHTFQEFRGWYHYQQQRKGNVRRLVLAEHHDGFPASKFTTSEWAVYCTDCAVIGLPAATLEDCDLLDALGEPTELDDEQEELELYAAEIDPDLDDLEDLEETVQ